MTTPSTPLPCGPGIAIPPMFVFSGHSGRSQDATAVPLSAAGCGHPPETDRSGYGHAMFLAQMTGASQGAGHHMDAGAGIAGPSCVAQSARFAGGRRPCDDRGIPVPLVIFPHPFPRGSEATQGRVSAVGAKWTTFLRETTRRPTRGGFGSPADPTVRRAFDLDTCRWIGASHVISRSSMINRTSKRARRLGDAGNAASVVFISTLAVEYASQNVLGERVEALKTDVAVNEALDVLVAARRIVSECEVALADGEVTPEEARSIMHRAQDALREAQESVQASEDAFHADRAVDAIRRGDGDYSPYRLRLLAGVGLTTLDEPDNVRQFPERDDAPVAG